MTLEAWLLFAVTEAALSAAPGPAVLLVISLGLTRSEAAGFRAGLGILMGNGFYFVLSATGVGALLAASHEAFELVKWAGTAYLIWLGMKMLLAGDHGRRPRAENTPEASTRGALAHGFVTQVANPKALLFFAALLPQFVNPAAPLVPQIGILAITSVSIEFAILTAYASLADRAANMGGRERLTALVNQVGGVLLIGAATSLATVAAEE